MIKEDWVRLDYIDVIDLGLQLAFLHSSPDSFWDEAYQTFFVQKGSKTHIWLILEFGDIFQ